jgi:GTP-binding protein EngB required for normal cell division
MREILSALRRIPAAGRYFGGLLVAIVLVLLLARPLGITGNGRWFLVGGVILVFGIFYLMRALRKRSEQQRSKEFEGSLGLQARQAGVGKEEIREALAELTERWELAVGELRERGISIYELPWFLLIGEPQSGKSTTLKSSGLEFPVGTEALSGSGGTRNCDWWFTNEAVILDTAGRFTFQEASAPDQHEWNAFLKLLAKHRKHCPINGVVVVIPVTSLIEDPVDVRESKARNIREKLMHLQAVLGIRFPVTVLITKCDRVLGFTELFNKLDPRDQLQLFGWSSRASQDESWDSSSFDRHFDEIVGRVHKMRLRFFHGEDNTAQIDKLFVFPEELQALREPLAHYLGVIFKTNRFEEPICLRGYYFTSGVQQGRPIALACRELLRVRAGDPLGVLENIEEVFHKSRAFFIRDFYERKLFPEQGLVSRTRAAIQKDRLKHRILFGAGVPAVVLFLVLFILAGATLKSTVGNINNTVKAAVECIDDEDSRGNGQCSIEDSWDLIKRLEACKESLREDRWALMMFWRGTDNQVSAEYIPAVQGELFRKRILPPLLASFESRAGSIDWGENLSSYPVFHEGLAELLTLYQYSESVYDPVQEEKYRSKLSVEKIVTFCNMHREADSSDRGEEIDLWLYELGSIEKTNKQLFKPLLQENPRIREIAVERPAAAIAAMRTFWKVETLAHWHFALTDYLKTYMVSLERLPDASRERRSQGIAIFTEDARALDKAWTSADEHLRSRLTRESWHCSDEREWEVCCRADFKALADIGDDAEAVLSWKSNGICKDIPIDLERMRMDFEEYAYLIETEPEASEGEAEDEEDTATGAQQWRWSADATAVKQAVVGLGELASAESMEQEIASFRERLGCKGRIGQLREVEEYYKAEATRIGEAISGLEGLGAELEVSREPLARMAELILSARVLPPVRDFVEAEMFSVGCADCFNQPYADLNVNAANKLIEWSNDELGTVRGDPDTGNDLAAINSSIHGYLSDFIDRMGGGGGGGTFYTRPTLASQAARWSEFVDRVSSWRYLETRRASGGGTGLTVGMLRGFAAANQALDDLPPRLERRLSGRSSSSGPEISDDFKDTIERFRRCVSSLSGEALPAWRQLAGAEGRGCLEDFHAFTSAPGLLRRESNAQWLADHLERHGAQLLVKEIEPQLEDAVDELWRVIDDYSEGLYPFMSQAELDDLRYSYERGYTDPGYREPRDDDRDRGRSSRRYQTVWREQRRDTRSIINVMDLPTTRLRDIERIFGHRNGPDKILNDFALDPILSGKEQEIDFVGPAKGTLLALQRWQLLLFGRDGEGGGRGLRERTFRVRMLAGSSRRDVISIHEGVPEVRFFGDATFRPSSDTRSGREETVPMLIDSNPLLIDGVDEDVQEGWTATLRLEGDDLKLLLFAEIASASEPRDERRLWEILVAIPDINRPGTSFEGIFELSFDQPIPGIVSDTRRGD